MTVKRGRGRPKKSKAGAPTKETQLLNRQKRLEENLKKALLSGEETLADNYSSYIEFLNNVALGKEEDASMTNRISCAKMLKDQAEKLMEGDPETEDTSKEDSLVETTVEEEESGGFQLISLNVANGK